MRALALVAFASGLAVPVWVGAGYAGRSPLALAMTLLIVAVYCVGGRELWRFQRTSLALQGAILGLQAAPERLSDWLATLPVQLQAAVKARIEGERSMLPGPALTPTLVGLLVLLGMLGTFIGMVVTLQGAVLALEQTTDLATIRDALAAPVKGLGLAFGTSVAGVAASAMLGLVSALARRDRLRVAGLLDTAIASHLRGFTGTQQREGMLQALQEQGRQLPQVLDRMQALMDQLARQSLELNDSMLAGQDRFHTVTQASYSALATSVERSLKDSVLAATQATAGAIEPLVARSMSGLTKQSAEFQSQLHSRMERQLDGLAARLDSSVAQVSRVWDEALAQQQQRNDSWSANLQQAVDTGRARMEAQLHAVMASWAQAQASQEAASQAREHERLAAWTTGLEQMKSGLQQSWQGHANLLQGQHADVCTTLARTALQIQDRTEAQAAQTLAEMRRLIETAAEAPRAAADLVGRLRQQLSDSLVQDKAMLDERSQVLATLSTLTQGLTLAATEQRAAIDALVASAGQLLQDKTTLLAHRIETESERLADAAAHVTGSAVEMASLGDAFGAAVQMFGSSSEALGLQLARIETALGKSTARSDEQLAYYVAQARELIDLSLSSQQQMLAELRQLTTAKAAPAVATERG